MLVDIINKILLIILFMCMLNVFRHAYYFIQAWFKSNTENSQKYRLTNKSLWILSLSIAYLLSSIFNGLFLN
jgi:hypothetical protein